MNAAHVGAEASGSPEQLAGVDLNLLVALDALARERSVTRAAHRVGVTQSAMSHSLRRLRELFNDALLVRGQSGMVLTPRAHALVLPLRTALVTLGRVLREPQAFEPRSAQRTFVIASPDLFDVLIAPRLLTVLQARAPAIDLTLVSASDAQLAERLETGDLDFAIVPRVDSRSAPPGPPTQGLVQTTLFRDGYGCLVRSGHPALGKKRALSLERYAALSHVLVAPRGQGLGQVDEALAERGLHRRIALRVPHFFTALAIVSRTDLVLTAPTARSALADAGLPVVTLPSPIALPRHRVNLLWHERFSNDPAHRFMRELLTEIAAARAPSANRVRRRPRQPKLR